MIYSSSGLDEMTSTPAAAGGVSTPAALERRLADVYGRSARRISHRSALSLGGMALMAGVTVSAEGSLYERARRGGWRHVAESSSTLRVAAVEVGADTWMSTPARALVECAQHACWLSGVDEIIAQALSKTAWLFDPGDLAAVAAELGWRAGLRRIASVAEALAGVADIADCRIPEHALSLLAVDAAYAEIGDRAKPGERWIGLDPSEGPSAAVRWDRRRRVWWHITPAELAEHLLY